MTRKELHGHSPNIVWVHERFLYSHDRFVYSAAGNMWTDPGNILLGAHELRARRTMCKSVFFSKVINCWRTIEAYSGLKSRGLGDSAPCRSGRNYWKTIVNKHTRSKQCWINFSTQDIIWKNMTQHCPLKADFTAEASQQWPEKDLQHRRLL